jgi:hypothetical protein
MDMERSQDIYINLYNINRMDSTLGIIITGQIRTFFSKGGANELLKVINKSKSVYSRIVLIMVISGDYKSYLLSELFKNISDLYLLIINYNEYEDHMLEYVEKLKNNSSFIKICQAYLNSSNYAKKEISDPSVYIIGVMRQLYQVRIGIDSINQYERNNKIKFNVIMKTRFDIAYPEDFYPHIPGGSLIDKISFNGMGISFNTHNIEEYIIWLKQQQIILPNCRVSCDFSKSFGGAYMYNYQSLENISKGDDNILYCFNDHFFFSKREVFVKLYDFINIYGTVYNNNIQHTFAAEAQLLIACFHVNISPLMFLPNTYSIIR